jgi:lipoprotein-anchoring transpeptidase ErfK/SrfK
VHIFRPVVFLILTVLAAQAQEAARPGLVNEREVMTQLQIFLDQQLFGPGKIDGRGGEFTTKALWCYQRAHGLTPTGRLDANIPLDSVFPIYTEYTIRQEDMTYVGTLALKPPEQAKQKYLPYDCVLEFLTERFHCDPDLLKQLNPSKNLDTVQPGDIVRVPNVEPFKIEELPKQGNLKAKPEFKHRTIHIFRKYRLLELSDGDALIASVPITPGSDKTPTPAGDWKIAGISSMPTFRWDEGVLNHGIRTETFYNLPAGPNNPVGVLWCQLNKPGIGIHGTNSPQTIGRSASHGCMRVANWDIVRLAHMITPEMKVTIE